MTRKHLSFCITLTLALTLCSGCMSRAVKEGIGAARGAKGFAAPMAGGTNDTPGSLMGKYTSVRLEPFSAVNETQTPLNLNSLLQQKFPEVIAEKGLIRMNAGGPTILVRGEYLYYEKAGVAGQLFGPFEEVIARVALVDADTQTVLVRANCVGRTTTSVNKGVEHKAQGLAKAIASLLEKHLTLPKE